MMTTTKPEQGDRQKEEFSRGKFRRNPILWFILASMLVHGVGSMVFVLVKRSQPVVQKNAKPTPIDFIVVPPEETPTDEPDKPAANTLPKGENQPGKAIEPEPAPPQPEKTEPVEPTQAVAVPKPVTPPPKPPQAAKPAPPQKPEPKPPEEKPDPVPPPPVVDKPETNQTPAEVLSGSDTAIKKPQIPETVKPPANITKPQKTTPTETAATPPQQPPTDVPQPEDRSVATRLPPKISPTPPESSATPPAVETPPPSPESAASLLGGGIERSLEDDGGESFFDLQSNANQQAYNPALLNEQQSIDMRKYFSEIQRRVRRNWNPNAPMEEYTTVLNFTVQNNGQITGLKVFQSSGSAEIDREALEAVQNSGPFAPLPESFPLDSVNIGFNFNIYIY